MIAPLIDCTKLNDAQFDVVILVNDKTSSLSSDQKPMEDALKEFAKLTPKLEEEVTLLPLPSHPSGRLIFSPTKPLNTDIADIRNVYEAAHTGVCRAIELECKAPLLCVGPLRSACGGDEWMERDNLVLGVLLGAYHAAYTPLEVREMRPERYPKVQKIGVMGASAKLREIASAIEEGRWVARDIGGSDPERMAAPKIVQYMQAEMLSLKGVTMTVEKVDINKYPLMAAVNRAASVIPRHEGRVVHLEYTPSSGDVDTNIHLVGKGITYDSGGADIKAGGHMAGMHRDKCGAAAIVGLFKTIGRLQPPGIAVHGALAFVRNSFGANAYVSDEIIISRAGQRVRVGNTDAEGRMVMADLLCEAKEKALDEKNPFLFTMATLTGHVVRAYGGYAAVLDNGPAREKHVSQKLRDAGDKIADMVEISTIRREDYESNKPGSETEDILQCNNLPSTMTNRGHQIPGAFLILASGLHKHGLDSPHPIPFTHIDVAGSAAEIHVQPTASPLMMLARHFVLPRVGMK
ncbi:unnamed protein product [Calicophoron daubneyi]|uniref:Cytosol aminopeptidase domain-containing protein n=1 Tax=Calicophoron daubneyi TaxID=300641 RepID=A0AAV2TW24_CALDB